MPTCARKHQLNTSLVYHVYSRSNGRITIFKEREDFYFFMELLRRYLGKFGLKLYHWVIMPNHYHLLLELLQPQELSKVMAGLSKAYSCYHHNKYFASGFLWQGRFKMQPIQKERYLLSCARYIERNPVSVCMVNKASDYPYSSARFYCLGEDDRITTEDPAFKEFGVDLSIRRSAYERFLFDFDSEEEQIFDGLEKPVGNSEFISRLIRENGRLIPRRRGRPRKELLRNSLGML